MIQLCFLLQLLGYCTLGLLPALVCFWVSPSPIVTGVGLYVSYHVTGTFTTQQLFWVYAMAGLIWWICSWYCEYADDVVEFKQKGQPQVPSFRGWCVIKVLTAFALYNGPRPPRDEHELLVLDTIMKAAIWYASKRELSPVDQGAKNAEPTCQRCMYLHSSTDPDTAPIASSAEDTDAPDEFPDHQIWAKLDASTKSRDHMAMPWPQPPEQPPSSTASDEKSPGAEQLISY